MPVEEYHGGQYRTRDAFWSPLHLGSFWWKPPGDTESEWLTRQIAAAPKLPLRFYQEVGLMEGYTSQIASNRRMRDTLREKGYEAGYTEYNGGHSFLNWSVGTATGLVNLLG